MNNKQNKQDLHLHTTYSDGKNTPEQMIIAALKKNFHTIAITDHMPLPFPDNCSMNYKKLIDYRRELFLLQQKYKNQINILVGLELDYLPHHLTWTKNIVNLEWDILIGSVHFFSITNQLQTPLIVDQSAETFQKILTTHFSNNIKKLVKDYYNLVKQSLQTNWFKIVGHIDLIKKYNNNNRFFNDKDNWYKKELETTLELVSKHQLTLEINTAGLNKPIQEAYPSNWIIDYCQNKKIPLSITSDAHEEQQIGQHFSQFSI